MNIIHINAVFNDAEWSFFHWEDNDHNKNRASDVTITTRHGDNYNITKVTLPREIAIRLEEDLHKEIDKTIKHKLYLKEEREVNVGDVIDTEHYGRGIVFSTDSMCGDIHLLSADGEMITGRYAHCDKKYQLLENPSYRKWLAILNKKKRELKSEDDYNNSFEKCIKILKERMKK